MEKLAIVAKGEMCFEPMLVANFIKQNFSEKKTEELHNAVFSYPHIPHKMYPLEHPDGIEGQHSNITQLPFDIKVNLDTRLSYNYHVAIHFKKPNQHITHGVILSMT